MAQDLLAEEREPSLELHWRPGSLAAGTLLGASLPVVLQQFGLVRASTPLLVVLLALGLLAGLLLPSVAYTLAKRQAREVLP